MGKRVFQTLLILVIPVSAAFAAGPALSTNVTATGTGTFGTIRGIVRDDSGSPIAEATVAIFPAGTSRLLKQVTSSLDGSFFAKIVPGTYTVLAVAQGFNPTYLFDVEVARSADLSYGLKLERAGSGETLPEKRLDRNSSKWRVRAAQTQRSIYQHQEGKDPVDEDLTASLETNSPSTDEISSGKKSQTIAETYFAGSENGSCAGINFATLLAIGDDKDLVIAGQTGRGKSAPQRLEADLSLHPFADHHLRLNSAVGLLGDISSADSNKQRPLGQISFQALDEWKVREGIIVVLGVDYSRFVGAGSDASLSPRIGLQYDLNAKTRFHTTFTTQTEEKNWARAVDLEGESFAFAEPVSVEDFVMVGGKPQMNRSRRFEFGIERIIDNSSSVNASFFFDTTPGRGVGLNSVAFDTLDGEGLGDFVADQHGKAKGISVVYTKRLNKVLTGTTGYSFGNGQKLSTAAITDPMHVFEGDFFQSLFGQLAADFKTGTSVRTIFRLSPAATVFAIDPFKGQLAIYDPGLSIIVTQSLPNFGLPLRAEAVLDGRNLFDFQSGVSSDEGSLKLAGQQRMLRGGIQVRF